MSVDDRLCYEAEALMRDLTIRQHEILAASEEEIERRMRDHYVDAVAILVRQQVRTEAWRGS